MIRVEPQSNTDSPGLPAHAPHPRPGSELSLVVELHRAGDDALLRVISLLHRRRCRVQTAQFSAGPGASGRLVLRLLAPPAHAGRIEQWLGSLIDVGAVARMPS